MSDQEIDQAINLKCHFPTGTSRSEMDSASDAGPGRTLDTLFQRRWRVPRTGFPAKRDRMELRPRRRPAVWPSDQNPRHEWVTEDPPDNVQVADEKNRGKGGVTTGPPRRLRYRYDRVLIDPRHLVGVSSSPLGITADDPFVIATVHPQRTLLRHLRRGDVTVRSVSLQTKYPDEVVRNEIVSLSSCPSLKIKPQSEKPGCNATSSWRKITVCPAFSVSSH